ncbi:MAG: alpha/beta hydrolase [Bacteroidota bacterium]
MKNLIFLFTFLVSISAVAQKKLVKVNGLNINVNVIGLEDREEGQAVIVFESGHGVPMDNWDRVLAGVVALAPLVTYERPGIGESEATEEEPTIKNVSDRLVSILKHLDIPPPYVLVGHSLGGLYVRGFAIHYPELLAGLIIVDPADFTETHQNKRAYYEVLGWEDAKVDSLMQSFIDRRNANHLKANPPIRREGQYLEAIRAREFEEIAEHQLPNIPVHILTGGRFDVPERMRSKEYDQEAVFRSKMKYRTARWMEVVQSVEKGMFFYSGDAGHYVHYDDPELLIASVKLVLSDYELIKGKNKK